jgi:hypothetical protein
MASHLLTCNCGQTVPVEVGQAGGQVVCSCGAKLDVPTLRNLRHLPLAPTNQPVSAKAWSARKGTIAVFLIAAGLLSAASLWNRLTEPKLPEFQPQSQSDMVDRHLDQVTPTNAWREWIVLYRPLAEKGFTPMESMDAPRIRAAIAHKRFLQSTMLSIAGVCFAVAALAALWPGGKTKQRRQ